MKTVVRIAILVMGFSGLVAEILLLREFLVVFSGNEISIGIVLANWLALEAMGSFLAGKTAERSKNGVGAFILTTLLFSSSLIVAILLIRLLRNMLGVSVGEDIGLLPMFYSSFVILIPVSTSHGALFPLSCRIYSMFCAQDAATTGKVYVYETIGTIIGGVVCTYLLIPYLDTFQTAFGLALLNSIVCVALLVPYWRIRPLQKALVVAQAVITFSFGYPMLSGHTDRLHHYSVQMQWKNLNVVHYQNSQYGNICVVENQGQYIYFLDGAPTIITPIPDIPFVEEFVHLPLLAHREPVNVLIVSGGVGGTIHEVLKHPSVQTIEYVELDPLLLSLFRKYPTPLTEAELNDKRVKTEHVDGRLLLKSTPNKYDVIFIGMTEPSDLQVNRFFTKEFFTLVKQRLNEEGILVLGAPGSLTLLNEEIRDLNSCVFHTLSSVFSSVRMIPGDGVNIFLSSNSKEALTIDKAQVIERLNERNMAAETTMPWRIEQKLHPGWQDWLVHFLEGGSQEINYDFRPIALFYNIAYWNALYAPSFGRVFNQLERINLEIILILFAAFLLFYFVVRSRHTRFYSVCIPFSVATTGFAGMIYDLVLVFAFQSIYGYIFSWIGILVASFMAGAACGGMLMSMVLARIQNEMNPFLKIELAIVCLSIGLPVALFGINAYADNEISSFGVKLLFLVIAFFCGLMVGSQFPLANKFYLKHSAGLTRTAGLLYATDLLGGWLGGIVGAVVLLPVLGVSGTCVTIGLLKLASFIVVYTQPQLVSARS